MTADVAPRRSQPFHNKRRWGWTGGLGRIVLGTVRGAAGVCVSEREGARGDLAVCAVEAIEALPLANTPEVFGLHPNAEIGYYTQAARDLWSHLLELQPQTGESSSGISREDYIGNVAKDIENKMPKVFDLDLVRRHLGASITPTSVVLLQELERFNKLLVRMSRSLAELQRNTFRTPVYTTSTRRNAMGVGLVFEADLFTTRHISHWVLQGVCLTLNSD
ncbi:Dynein heavy chain 10, axonemal [Myotis davidii]|uniref:Dynein heavy chain 10, axonemal n=1 Tax=Myotis davidii TaxID=225400 RepID=L5LK58_MYODS|nr:Dynein heavy chain 10, axonemal [Myotis davidii]